MLNFGKAIDNGLNPTSAYDAVFIAESAERVLLIDSMGNNGAAQKAAQLVMDTLNDNLIATTGRDAILSALPIAYQKATTAIQMPGLDACASATTVCINEDIAYIGHVGNTRAYVVSRASIDQLTTDHTMEEKSLEFGMTFTGDAYAPILMRAIGQSDEAADTLIVRFGQGLGILLISDGVYRAGAQLIEYDDIEDVMLPMNDDALLEIIKRSTDAQATCDALLAAAKNQGARDNLSAVFISNNFGFKSPA